MTKAMTDAASCSFCGAPLPFPEVDCAACLLLGAVTEKPSAEGTLGRLGSHELLELLARGGMGVVYRARQCDPVREVALKALPGGELHSPEAHQRFRLEAEAMARLEHPAILPVYEFGEADGTPYFTMKLAAGGSLAERIGTYSGNWRAIAELMATVAEAVHFAHSRGVLHRDLKPGNILFDETGAPFVSDFGLAKMLGSDSDLTRTLALIGTPNYMAPERITDAAAGATVQSDVWSLGVILHELLAGRPPFSGENIPAVLRSVEADEPPALSPQVPRDLRVIALKALSRKPALRFDSAASFAADLRRWLRGDPVSARTPPVGERIVRWTRRHPWRAALAMLVAGGVALILWVSIVLNRSNHEIAARNRELREELSIALAEQAAARLTQEHPELRSRLLDDLARAAQQAPTERARTVAASVLALPGGSTLPHAIAYRGLLKHGETTALSADFSRVLTYEYEDAEHKDRRLILRDASSAATLWQINLKGPSGLQMEMSDNAKTIILQNGARVEIRNGADGKETGTIEPAVFNSWSAVALHPQKPLLAWVDAQGDLKVRSLTSGKEIVVGRPTTPLTALTWSQQGDQLATASAQAVEMWQVRPGAEVTSVPFPGAFRPMHWAEGTLLVSHRARPEVSSIRGGKVIATFRLSGNSCTGLTSIPGSWLAASVSSDEALWIWDTRDGSRFLRASGGPGYVRSSPDGTTIAAAWTNTRIMQHRLTPDEVFREFQCSATPGYRGGDKIRMSLDGRLLLTRSPERIYLWDTDNRRLAFIWPAGSNPEGIVLPDASAVFVGAPDGDGLQRRSITWNQGRPSFGDAEPVADTAQWVPLMVDPRGTRYLMRRGPLHSLWEGDARGPARVVSLVPSLDRGRSWSSSFKFGWNSGSRENPLIFDGFSNRTLRRIEFDGWTGMIQFSADEQWMMARSRARFRLVSTSDWQERWSSICLVTGNQFGYAAISPDSRLAATEERRDIVSLRSVSGGQKLIDLETRRCHDIKAIEFSADSRRLYVLDARHRLYEWNLDALRRELRRLGLDWND